MADNVAITAGAGTTIGADEVTDGTLGVVKVQYVKIMDGTLDGTAKTVVKAASTAAAATDTALVVSFAAANCATKVGDGTNSAAIKAASTAAAATDPAMVVSFAGANCATKITDATNTAAVKAASTAPAATDPALVVAISPNTPAMGALGQGATGSAAPSGASYEGLRAATANPTNATGGNLVGNMGDKAGRSVVTMGHVRELVGKAVLTIASSSAETTLVGATANEFHDLTSLVITNASATAYNVTLRDITGAGTAHIFDIAANGGIVVNFPVPLPQTTANNNWTVALSSAAVTCHFTAIFLKNL